MPSVERQIRFSFQTKVLVPVLAALVLLPTATFWIVNRSITRQVEAEARQSLSTAEAVFRQTIDFRARDLLTRFRYAVNEPSYRAIAPLLGSSDPMARKEINRFLLDRLEAYGADCDALILSAAQSPAQVATRLNTTSDAEGWTRVTAQLMRIAQQGEPIQGTLEFRGRVYVVVSVPVSGLDNNSLAGVLTVATQISEAALQELKSLTGTEILLIAENGITASTLRQPELSTLLPNLLQPERANGGKILPAEINQKHYFALTNGYEYRGPEGGFRYVLLSSYEQRLQELENTRATLLLVSVIGILLSGLTTWFLVRRITQPLVELRANAEAVGRGDFTRRIAQFSNDECGAVAIAFNDMTGNLQASRAELEKAVGTLKQTQAQLLQSEKLSAVGQFVAGVAHELNNPLTSVIGFSELLQHMELDPKNRGYVDRIAKSAARCHKIVTSLLGFSRQHEPERKPVRINELADAVIEIIAYDVRASNITLVKEYTPDLPLILGDAHQLQQVILNIMSNARQALEPYRRDGEIVLRTGCTDTEVWLRIKDNGPGIHRDTLSRIFDPFYTTKPQGQGTGLGLSLSYGIMQEHRGHIRAESQPGDGTEFILKWPIPDIANLPGVVRPPSTPPLPARTPGLRVLVIDDEESILQLTREVLRAEGHRVETADGGAAALSLISQNHYDVIISDWKMPGLNGINLFQELLAKNPAAARRMLFMTGDVIKADFQSFLKMHNRTCLPKPFALREFRAAIAAIIHTAGPD